LRALLEDRLLTHRRFRERIRETRFRIGRPRWEREPAFSLDAHLERETLPAPGSRAQLEELVARWMNTPFDRSRSPWRLVRVDGYARGTALVAHLHHAMGDGFALIDVLLSLSEDRPAHGARASRAARWFRGGARWKQAPHIAFGAARALVRLVTLSLARLHRHRRAHERALGRGAPLSRRARRADRRALDPRRDAGQPAARRGARRPRARQLVRARLRGSADRDGRSGRAPRSHPPD